MSWCSKTDNIETITIEIPDGKRAEWVDGVLTFVDEQPKDITKRIKTFDDACNWCNENDMSKLVEDYNVIYYDWPYTHGGPSDDILAYLKLRIITCALNEGETENCCFYPIVDDIADEVVDSFYSNKLQFTMPASLLFKTFELAEYAATQFKDIYMDFCYKGKELK